MIRVKRNHRDETKPQDSCDQLIDSIGVGQHIQSDDEQNHHYDLHKELIADGWVSKRAINLDEGCEGFEPTAVESKSQTVAYRPDTLLDGWAIDYCIVRAASLRGKSHRRTGKPRQDDIAIRIRDDIPALIITVADGVSSVSHAHIASTVATRYITQWLAEDPLLSHQSIEWEKLIGYASEALVNQAENIHSGLGRQLEKIRRVVATTVVCAVIFPTCTPGTLHVKLCSVGDSGAWVIDQGKVVHLCGGKKINEDEVYDGSTYCLPDPYPCLEVTSFDIMKDQVLLIGTDGFGDPLGDGTYQVGKLYSSVLSKRVPSILEFGHMLDFNLRSFGDDRSLVAVWPQTWRS